MKKLLTICALLMAMQPAIAQTINVEQRVESILKQMTIEEKIGLIGGAGSLFDIRGIPRLNVPSMTAADGPFGVRNFTRTNVYAGGIALAASWNTDLAQRLGTQLGRDARSRGVHFYLAPGVNIYRAPQNGRNFEYFGEDPYLAGRAAAALISGVQSQGVAATVKHYLANNSEFARHTTDVIIDERTAREIYLPAFEAAVKSGHVAAVMDAYNLVDGEHMTENHRFNVQILKQEWGFNGVLISDWDATYGTLAAANGGLDLEMPSSKYFNAESLLPLLRGGQVSGQVLDDKVRRILRTAVQLGWLDRPQLDASISRYDVAGRAASLQGAQEGIVLLKNTDGVLPLDRNKIRSLAVIGPNAYPAVLNGGGSATVAPFHASSLLEGLSAESNDGVDIRYARGIADYQRFARSTKWAASAAGEKPGIQVQEFDNLDLSGPPARTRIARHIDQGEPLDLLALASGDRPLDLAAFGAVHPSSARWSGYFTPAVPGEHDLFVQVSGFDKDIGYRAYVDDKLVIDHWSWKKAAVKAVTLTLDSRAHKIVLEHRAGAGGLDGKVPFVRLGLVPKGGWVEPSAEQFAAQADAVIVAVGFDYASEAEAWDRAFELPPGQDELLRKVCAANKRCIVVVNSGGAVDTTAWLERVPALLQAWYLGQDGGEAVAKILFGTVNPSGHLPVTFERRWQDNPVHDSYYPEPGTSQVRYKEGVFVGYRGYEARNIKPQFPFGFGLSYTSFEYRDLEVRKTNTPDHAYEAVFSVKNIGSRAGAAVPQLYISAPNSAVPRPKKELKGFTKFLLQPGESRQVVLPLDARSFAYFDVAGKRWRADAGVYRVLIGESTEQIALTGAVQIDHSITVGK
ncbi:MAG TPA: glycoside hydrolase family 3 C-terminal domain-containing protein [Steroidobacteraceae bacterium]|nr:glycoside hydrolase family 3 C-terminal domain-containing protein [Steroidobacteraceae bacterium]